MTTNNIHIIYTSYPIRYIYYIYIYVENMVIEGDLSYKDMRSQTEKIRKDLKNEWNTLWKNKYDDERAAEGVSIENYSMLDVDQGQVIYATRSCKQIIFEDILEQRLGSNYADKIIPTPEVGGWKKFARNNLPRSKSRRDKPEIKADLNQHQRKHGKGWLNQIRINKKSK
jgi:hypothetical protein